MPVDWKEKAVKLDWMVRRNLDEHKIEILVEALASAYKQGWKDCRDKVEDVCAEFGDDPKACLGIIGEQLRGGKDVEY